VALLRKETCNLRHPIHLRHPVLSSTTVSISLSFSFSVLHTQVAKEGRLLPRHLSQDTQTLTSKSSDAKFNHNLNQELSFLTQNLAALDEDAPLDPARDNRQVCVCVAVCCSVLQCAAVCCSVLQCVVVCCIVLQCAAVCCSVLQCAAVCCSVLQCVAVCCMTSAVCCSVLQCAAVCCSVLQCVA